MSAVSKKLIPASRARSTRRRASSTCVLPHEPLPPPPPNVAVPKDSTGTLSPDLPSCRYSISGLPCGWFFDPSRRLIAAVDVIRRPAARYACAVHRIFRTSVASVYPLYVTKLEKKGRSKDELDEVIEWLTGFDRAALHRQLADGATFEEFFADAHVNPKASQITGMVCGMRVGQIEDPLMQKIRYLDKLVDELARGKVMQKVLREA